MRKYRKESWATRISTVPPRQQAYDSKKRGRLSCCCTLVVAAALSAVPSFGAVSYRPAPEGIPGVVLVTADADGDSASCAHKSVTFTPGANVTVDLSAFSANLKTLAREYVLTWDTPPASSVKFVPDAATKNRGYSFVKESGGLKLITTGFTIFVR